ncbi:MAG: DUF1570 domain-containing protein [Planctomycetaceae bacterium]|nr:DUF1570 domain-containing protein [Planctomycetaceae bacterium]
MSPSTCVHCLWLVAVLVWTGREAVSAPLLELTVGENTYCGKSLGHDDNVCWLAQEDGRIARISLPQVTSFRRTSEDFRSLQTIEVRNELRKEFGHDWEITGTGHYLVCAPKGRGRHFAQAFEEVYRSFRSDFSRRGFVLPQPEFPLIAVVYPNAGSFAARCRQDEVPFLPGLKGYYHRLTNRTCLFENEVDRLGAAFDHSSAHIVTAEALTRRNRVAEMGRKFSDGLLDGTPWDSAIEADLKATIIHEATHQVAYNLGLHTRIGENPKWITEGLATMMEADGVRRNPGGGRSKDRLNQSRFEQFCVFADQRRQRGSLAAFVSSDRPFLSAMLDGYAQAWALTFFLAETRSSQYAAYLKTVASRDPLQPYTPEDRLADFQAAFGTDVSRLEVAFLRFIDSLR